jgi:hypothetical protein
MDCVEVASLGAGVAAVRDSKDPSGAVLTFSAGSWRRFLTKVKAGQFDN